jgi:hypothetical protein
LAIWHTALHVEVPEVKLGPQLENVNLPEICCRPTIAEQQSLKTIRVIVQRFTVQIALATLGETVGKAM